MKPIIPENLLLPIDKLNKPETNVDGSIKLSNLVKWGCECTQKYSELRLKYEALQKIFLKGSK